MQSALAFVEHWTVRLVGLAAGLYVLRCVPIILVPFGVIGALLLLVLGFLLAIVSAGISVVAGWYMLSEPAPASRKSEQVTVTPPPGTEPAIGESSQHQQTTYSQLVEQMIPMAGGREGPPPTLSRQGEFSDWVYTIPTSKYDRNEALANWPPETEGDKAMATKWFALARGGELFLAEKPATSNNKFVPMVTVPLAGCTIHIPCEGLRGKSKWWKKCPLDISHPENVLLSQQNSFFMFASDGFAKTQWYGVLLWGAHKGGVAQAVESMFDDFSASVRKGSRVPHLLPQMLPEGEEAALLSRGAKAGSRWGVLRSMGFRRSTTRSASRKEKSKAAPAAPSVAVNPDDLDAMWYQPKAAAQQTPRISSDPGMQGPAAGAEPAALQKSASAAPTAGRDASAAASAAKAHAASTAVPSSSHREPSRLGRDVARDAGSSEQMAVQSEPENSAAERTASGSTIMSSDDEHLRQAPLQRGLNHPQQPNSHPASPLSSPQSKLPPLPPPSSRSMPAGVGGAGDPPTSPTTQSQHGIDKSKSSEARDARDGTHHHAAPEDAWAPEREPTEAAVNMLIARVAFDLLRLPLFREAAAAYVQRKLDQLRYPAYIEPLKVVDICVGRTVPEVDNFRALPTPAGSPAIWPQFLLDIAYHGEAWVIVETSVDLRSSNAWSQFDEAIGHWGGETAAQHAEPAIPSDDDISDADADMAAEKGSPQAAAAVAKRRRLLDMAPLRKAAASRIRRIADSAAKIPLRLKVKISSIEGTMLAWLPPPPGDRLWTAFTSLRALDLTARPVVGSRMLKGTAQASRVSQWIEAKLKRSITKNMMYPACSDLRLPYLITFDHPDIARPIPTIKPDQEEKEQAKAAEGDGKTAKTGNKGGKGDGSRGGSGGRKFFSVLTGDGRSQREPLTNLAALRATAEMLAAQNSGDEAAAPAGDCRADSAVVGSSNEGDSNFADVVVAAQRASRDGTLDSQSSSQQQLANKSQSAGSAANSAGCATSKSEPGSRQDRSTIGTDSCESVGAAAATGASVDAAGAAATARQQRASLQGSPGKRRSIDRSLRQTDGGSPPPEEVEMTTFTPLHARTSAAEQPSTSAATAAETAVQSSAPGSSNGTSLVASMEGGQKAEEGHEQRDTAPPTAACAAADQPSQSQPADPQPTQRSASVESPQSQAHDTGAGAVHLQRTHSTLSYSRRRSTSLPAPTTAAPGKGETLQGQQQLRVVVQPPASGDIDGSMNGSSPSAGLSPGSEEAGHLVAPSQHPAGASPRAGNSRLPPTKQQNNSWRLSTKSFTDRFDNLRKEAATSWKEATDNFKKNANEKAEPKQ